MGRLFGTDGVRGIANVELSCELALSIGRAIGHIFNGKENRTSVLIGSDTRISGDMLTSALTSGLCSMGVNVICLGTVSTPCVAYLVRALSANAGIMVSASHNPSEYNGIKIFGSDGYKLPDALEDMIESIVLEPSKHISLTADTVGRCRVLYDSVNMYSEYLKGTVNEDFGGLKVALDCANGSASVSAPNIFTELGADVTVLSSEPDGFNINASCGSTHVEALRDAVVKNSLDVGFAFDGDADRCLCIDERGELVDGDQILAMCSLDLKIRGKLKNNTVVGTVMSNFGFNKFCEENSISFLATKVGDRYVLEEMLLGDFVIGGEQSGHIIFSDFATTGDGQLTALQVLSLMNRSGKKLSELKSVMKKYPQELINVSVSAEGKLRFYNDLDVQSAIKDAENVLAGEGRILVRPSGTEPLIRVMTEGSDKPLITSLAKKVAEKIAEKLS